MNEFVMHLFIVSKFLFMSLTHHCHDHYSFRSWYSIEALNYLYLTCYVIAPSCFGYLA